MGRRLASVVTASLPSVPPCHSPRLCTVFSLLLFFTILHSGQAVEGYSLAAAKDGSRITTTTAAPPVVAEEHYSAHRGQEDSGRGGHGIEHHGHGHVVGAQQPLKHHHQHQHEDSSHKPHPDFERQLSQLKEDPGSTVESNPRPPLIEDDTPIKPVSRKDDLFTPGLGVEEVSVLAPIRRPSKNDDGEDKGEDDLSEARPLDVPLQPDLLESEADVLEELKKLSAIHDVMDSSHLEPPTRPPFKVEEPSGTGIGGAVEDHFGKSDEDEDEDSEEEDKEGEESDEEEDESNDEEEEEEEDEEETTEDPAREVASLEERLSTSLRKLAERRKQSQKVNSAAEGKLSPSALEEYNAHSASGRAEVGYSPSGYYSGPGTAPETASGSAPGTAPGGSEDSSPGAYPGVPRTYPIGGEITSSAPVSAPEMHAEKGEERAVMKKAHMARKLMDPEDPKKDEDLLELMLRIAENPDEWKRVHHLLRQLDDDLTTYEKTMHRVEALALEKSSEREKGRNKAEEEEEDAEQRRIEMSKSGLPSGTHGENLSSTTQQPLQTSSTVTSTHHKDWPRFAYHRVTTAPHPYFLQQQQNHQEGPPHHRNAYIAVSVITPPKGRHGGTSRPLPSPPPVNAVSPTPEGPYQRHVYGSPVPPQPRVVVDVGEREISEETIREPMEEEIVESVAKAAFRGRHHKAHGDPIEEQLRTLAGVEAKLRHRLHEKERMRHILKEAGRGEQYDDFSRSKRSAERSANNRQHRPNGLILLKTS